MPRISQRKGRCAVSLTTLSNKHLTVTISSRGADYICIEPWINAPDFVDSDMHIAHKPGCLCLKPGEKVSRSHVITVL